MLLTTSCCTISEATVMGVAGVSTRSGSKVTISSISRSPEVASEWPQ